MLGKYKMLVDCVTHGQDAIDRVKCGEPVYDVIFMDHIMPEIDGMEAARLIRGIDSEYARTVPIIALTANADEGYEEMFLKCGFQAFLSKPVSIVKLDSVIRRWICDVPDKEKETFDLTSKIDEAASKMDIPGLDVRKGLLLFNGDLEVYRSVLRSYASSAREVMDKLSGVSSHTLPDYYICAHSIKGSSANIGAEDIRKTSSMLMNLAKAGDLSGVLDKNEVLLEDMKKLVYNIEAWLSKMSAKDVKPLEKAPDRVVLSRLKQCCEAYDIRGADMAMEELENKNYAADADIVAWLRKKIGTSDFSEITERISEYLDIER
jgi:CheY-like chemotaxis protein